MGLRKLSTTLTKSPAARITIPASPSRSWIMAAGTQTKVDPKTGTKARIVAIKLQRKAT